jgi:hypothetical protein
MAINIEVKYAEEIAIRIARLLDVKIETNRDGDPAINHIPAYALGHTFKSIVEDVIRKDKNYNGR